MNSKNHFWFWRKNKAWKHGTLFICLVFCFCPWHSLFFFFFMRDTGDRPNASSALLSIVSASCLRAFLLASSPLGFHELSYACLCASCGIPRFYAWHWRLFQRVCFTFKRFCVMSSRRLHSNYTNSHALLVYFVIRSLSLTCFLFSCFLRDIEDSFNSSVLFSGVYLSHPSA